MFATHDGTECYLKRATTMTPFKKDGVTLVVRTDKPTPPPNPNPVPWPPLPPAKYKVELVEHNALPALSHGNPAGQGGSPCNNTFNPSYIEVAGTVTSTFPRLCSGMCSTQSHAHRGDGC